MSGVSVKLHLKHERTNAKTPGIEFGAFSFKMRHLVAIIFYDFPDNQLTKFCVFSDLFRIFTPPLKFL